MEVTDFSDILSVRTIKMENSFDEATGVESSDPLLVPHFVTESDLGLMQSGAEMLQTPLAVFDTADDDDTMQSNESSEEVIIQLMDIRTRLSKLRAMLEARLGADLADYTFWLQDAKMLENHKTLVEQCIRGEGVVQVNIQISAAERKINILDVLKPDEEMTRPTPDYPEDEEDDEECLPQTEDEGAVDMEAVSGQTESTVKWVVDAQFKHDHRVKIPDDPRLWSVQHVKLWIQWAVRQFNLAGVRLSDWALSGSRLCSLSNKEFKEKVPSDPGDIFWTHFELLRKCKFIAVVQSEESPTNKDPLEIDNMQQSAIKKKPKLTATRSVPPAEDLPARAGNNGQVQLWQFLLELLTSAEHYDVIRWHAEDLPARAGNNGQVQLWQFLLELLTSAEHYDVIRWHGTEGEFKLLEPERVARLWGARKHKPAMNYEKLSRALRYYYDGDMIAKVPGKRFVYKFVCDLRQLVGYGAGELAALVRDLAQREMLLSCGVDG